MVSQKILAIAARLRSQLVSMPALFIYFVNVPLFELITEPLYLNPINYVRQEQRIKQNKWRQVDDAP